MTTAPKISLTRLRELIKEEVVALNEARPGQRVQIKSGMPQFVGQTGEIVGVERDGRTKMYRVRLDRPVEIPGLGPVTDDLWAAEHLKTLREAVDHKSINSVVTVASKLLAAVEGFKEKAPPAAINAVTPHLGELEKMLENMVSNPGSYVPAPKKEPKKVSLVAKKA